LTTNVLNLPSGFTTADLNFKVVKSAAAPHVKVKLLENVGTSKNLMDPNLAATLPSFSTSILMPKVLDGKTALNQNTPSYLGWGFVDGWARRRRELSI
jgi:hypothetical protein